MHFEILQPRPDRSAGQTPGQTRPHFICQIMAKDQDAKPAQQYIRHLCNIPEIRIRSAKRSARARTGPVSSTNRKHYKSFSIFQPKFHENFVKFAKNAVLVFEPVKLYRGGVQILPDLKFFCEKFLNTNLFWHFSRDFKNPVFPVHIKPISTQLFLEKSSSDHQPCIRYRAHTATENLQLSLLCAYPFDSRFRSCKRA